MTDPQGKKSVRRAGTKTTSRQPRFSGKDNMVFGSVIRWLKLADIEEPPYSTSSMLRDGWLQRFWMREPHLAGVLNSVILIDANRGWEMVGGRNQVNRFSSIAHSADDGKGWRHYVRKVSQSYWTTDLGAITEIGRDGPNGPLRALYSTDSSRFQLTGDPDLPIEYHPEGGVKQMWRSDDFFRVVSMPTPLEAFRELGFCAMSRCLDLAKLLVAVYQHDSERLGAQMPRGILFLDNITEPQWEDSLQKREADLTALERKHYGGVQVIASGGIESANARLVALSSLPDEFDREVFANQLMYGYALCFGYDPSEFWPLQYGALGRGTETETQARKASGKGGLDFAATFQEMFQNNLPETLEFTFDERDQAGELADAELVKARIESVRGAYETGLMEGVPLLTRDEARQLLVDSGVIPADWTVQLEEKVTETDTQEERSLRLSVARSRARTSDRVLMAAREFPDEPVVAYRWRTAGEHVLTLFRDGRELYPFRIVRPSVARQADAEPAILFQGDNWQITEQDVVDAIRAGSRRLGDEYGQLLTAPIVSGEGEET